MKLLRYYHTIRHLRFRQVWYRLWRPVQKRFYKQKAAPERAVQTARSWPWLSLHSFEPHDIFNPPANTFSFLNLSAEYPGIIDWNEDCHGLLWAFHLNYFSWLEDERVSMDARFATIQQYTGAKEAIAVGLSSYTISLRSVAWIRFFLKHGVRDEAAVGMLYTHLARLYRFPEYELDGNHLWENGCALFAGGLYFKDDPFYEKGSAILKEVLRDQLAIDGMHLEASPMYHSLLLHRLLMCMELFEKLRPDEVLPGFIQGAAAKMLGWISAFAFNDGSWAMVNDSAPGLAPNLKALTLLAADLGIPAGQTPLQSHYRFFKNDFFELMMDVGDLTPAWQTGHHHADTLSFCMRADGVPIIVDTGISTYDPSTTRQFQRSTAAHNTISIDGSSSSDVWKSFRTGRRARVSIVLDTTWRIEARHDGYKRIGVRHVRNIQIGVDKIIIEDQLKGLKTQNALLHLHFHPDMAIKKIAENKYLVRNLLIAFENAGQVVEESYTFAADWNRTREAQKLVIAVTAYTSTTIERINTTNAD